MPTNKALQYAEETLSVHSVYLHVLEQQERLNKARGVLISRRHKNRELDEKLDSIQMDIVSEEWAKHPEMAQTRMDKHVKVAVQKNPDHSVTRMQKQELEREIEFAEAEIKQLEIEIRTGTARMDQLGGYLNYLAVTKYAGTLPRKTEITIQPTSLEELTERAQQ